MIERAASRTPSKVPCPDPMPGRASLSSRARAGARARSLLVSVPRLALTATIASFALVAAPREASAQLRWDASAQVGVSKRFLTSAFTQPSFGPMAIVSGHIALIPLLRVGAYVAHDISPLESQPARRFYAIGARAKLQAPWASTTLHGWAFAGAGFVGAYGPSETRTLVSSPIGPLATTPSGPGSFSVAGASGRYFEVPFGLGMAVRLRKPWELVFELGGRVGVGFGGDLYASRAAVPAGAEIAPQRVVSAGNDAFAAFLTAGVGFDL